MKRRGARALASALLAMRKFLGSIDHVSVHDQQRLYNSTLAKVRRVAERRGMSIADAWDQIETEGRRRGAIRPIPGRDL